MEKLPGIKLFDLTRKSAIVTGGSKGLGLAIAAGLASAGASVMLFNRNAQEGKLAAEYLASTYGTKAISFAGDITNREHTERMAEEAMSKFGSLDILVNSAGINIRGAIDEVTPEDFAQ